MQVRATDGSGNSSTQTLTITVTDVNEVLLVVTGPGTTDLSVSPGATNWTYGTALSLTRLGLSHNLPGSYVIGPAGGTILPAGTTNVTVVFTATDTSYVVVSNVVAVTVTKVALTVRADDKSKVYGAANPSFTSTITGFVNGENLGTSGVSGNPGLSTAATSVSEIGNYQIGATTGFLSANNYSFIFASGTLVVSRAPLTVRASNKTKVYGQTLSLDGASDFSLSGLLNSDAVSRVTLASTGTSATATVASSPYLITASAATGTGLANYSISYVNGSLTITRASLTITAASKTKIYGESLTLNNSSDFSTSGLQRGDTVDAVVLSSIGTPATASVGGSPYSVALRGASGVGLVNYAITYVASTLVVNPAALKITAVNKTKIYAESMILDGALDFIAAGLLNGDSVGVVSLTSGGLNATASVSGSPYAIAPSAAVGKGLGNYTISYVNGALVINRAGLLVTADVKARVFNTGNPTLTYTVTGFVNGETTTVLTGIPALNTPADKSSPIGSYQISISANTLSSTNYSFTFANGRLEVTTASVVVTAPGTSDLANSPGATSLVYGTAITPIQLGLGSNQAGTFTLTPASGTVMPTGLTNVTVGFIPTNTSYMGVTNLVVVSVTKAPLTVTVDSTSTVYGTAAGALSYRLSGFVNGESLGSSGVTGSPSLSTGGTATRGVGNYPITAATGTLAAANYSFEFISGLLTIVNPSLPIARNDLVNAREASGQKNEIPGAAGTGNVLVNDSGSSILVIGMKSGGGGNPSPGQPLRGLYGTVTLGATGEYAYLPDDEIELVDSLNAGGVLTDTFSYTISDNAGQLALGILSITIHGANDAPTSARVSPQRGFVGAALQPIIIPAFGDVDDTVLTYAAMKADGGALPSWLTFDGTTRTFKGTPPVGSVGVLQLKVTGSDGELTAGAFFSLTVEPSELPVVKSDVGTAKEAGGTNNGTKGFSANGNLLGNDTGMGLSVTSMANSNGAAGKAQRPLRGLYGALLFEVDGSYTYVVDEAHGWVQALNSADRLIETFSYSVASQAGQVAEGLLTLTIIGANDAPISSAPLTLSGKVGVAIPTVTMAGFVDLDNSKLIYSASMADGTSLPSWLSFDIKTLSFRGVPPAQSVGASIILVTGSDGSLAASTTVALIINIAGPPKPQDDGAIAQEAGGVHNGSPGFEAAGNVLANDVGYGLVITSLKNAESVSVAPGSLLAGAFGNLTVRGDGRFVYVLNNLNEAVESLKRDETLVESFVYSVRDVDGQNATATLNIVIQGANDSPVGTFINSVSAVVEELISDVVIRGFLDVDHDFLVYSAMLADGSPLPSWLNFDAREQKFSGTPPVGSQGQLTIQVTASDGSLSGSSVFALSINLQDGPRGSNITAFARESEGVNNGTLGFQATGNVLLNNTGTKLVVSGISTVGGVAGVIGKDSTAMYGSLTLNGDGTFRYVVNEANGVVETLNDGQDVSESFIYRIMDRVGQVASAILTITIQGGNDSPSAKDDLFVVSENTDLEGVSVASNDTDPDSAKLVFHLLDAPDHGSLRLEPDGAISYRPKADYYGSVSFTYEAADDHGLTSVGSVQIIVAAKPVNHLPNPPVQYVYQESLLVFSKTHDTGHRIWVNDADSSSLTVRLTVLEGDLYVVNTNKVRFLNNVTGGTNAISMSGSIEDLNEALDDLVYSPKTKFFGEDRLQITTVDEGGRFDSDNNAVRIIVEIPTLGGNPTFTLDYFNNTSDGTITNLLVMDYDKSLIASVSFDLRTGLFQIVPIPRQDGTVHRTSVRVLVTFQNGVSVEFAGPIIIYQPNLTAVEDGYYGSTYGTNGVASGSPVFNPQTGLYEQKVRVVNQTPFTFKGFRIYTSSLPPHIQLRNRTGLNEIGPYIDFSESTVESGQEQSVTLEYFNRTYQPFTPELSLRLLEDSNGPVSGKTGKIIRSEIFLGYTPDGRRKGYIQIQTVVGLHYQVQYSDNPNGLLASGNITWTSSPVTVAGTGLLVNWQDDGPPSTRSSPTELALGSVRVYRIIEYTP